MNCELNTTMFIHYARCDTNPLDIFKNYWGTIVQKRQRYIQMYLKKRLIKQYTQCIIFLTLKIDVMIKGKYKQLCLHCQCSGICAISYTQTLAPMRRKTLNIEILI